MNKPLIIHVTHELSAGGAERVVTDLAIHLPKHGFDVEVITVLKGGLFKKELKAKGIRVTVLSRKGLFGWKTVRELVRIFKDRRPAVVHTHLFLADTWGRIAAKIARVPIRISTEHNVNVTYRTIHHITNRFLSGVTDRFIAVSSEVKRIMIQNGISDRKIKTIRNGIDVSRFRARGNRPFHDPPRLLLVARFFEQKNHELLFKALARVREPWILQLVGEGPLERDLRALADQLKISSRIEWLGVRDDVPEILKKADIFCFPSSWEGLGLVAVEAAASGLPVIASNLKPLREVFTNKEVTFVDAHNIVEWSASISYALAHPKEMLNRADRTMLKVRATMGVETMIESHVDLYRSLIKEKGL